MTTAATTNRLAGFGLAVELPDRWEGRVYQRPIRASRLSAEPDGHSHPVLHLANFALPGSRGDYGTGAVERMRAGHVFIALVQFGPDCLGTALFEPAGFPVLRAGDFNPNGLQRTIAGQAGFQHFFTATGRQGSRPMCLYVVLGAHRQAGALCGQINQVISRIEVAG